jgi:hypothetical protein
LRWGYCGLGKRFASIEDRGDLTNASTSQHH